MIEGKIEIWIKGGEFSHSSDLYVKVMADSRQVWKTKESDSSKPEWNSNCTKHIKGEYNELIFQLMDKDTFSKDDLLGTCRFSMEKIEREGLDGEYTVCNADNEPIGKLNLYCKFEAGDVSFFDLGQSRIHNSDED